MNGLDSLLCLSARIGRNPLLVQASSGNTSLKLDGTLWIKASGRWLAFADREEILVPVELSECLECLRRNAPLPPHNGNGWPAHLRPSIETFMHAVLPHRVVLHVHSINTIAWAVRADAPLRLTEKLSGLRWQWIPYTFSGIPLARAIEAASTGDPAANVFVLGNHGLVVCGDDCDSAQALLTEVERRLEIPPRMAAEVDSHPLDQMAYCSDWRRPDVDALQALGRDVISKRIMDGGVLYPCQAIFLGPTLPRVPSATQFNEINGSSPVVVVDGDGVFTKKSITAAEWATLNGFAEVVRRIEPSAPIRYLTDHEVTSVMGVEGHHYRMSAENQMSAIAN